MVESETNAPTLKRKRVSRVERSRLIWEEVETAVRDLAIQRGWPHENLEDLDLAVRRLDEENPEMDGTFRWGFLASQTFRDNIQLDYMEMWEVKSGHTMAKNYIKKLKALP